MKLPWSRSILPFPKLSVRESSPKNIGGPFNMLREENSSFVKTICLEAPESMIKLGDLDVRHVLSLCPLNLIFLPFFLSNQEGRCYYSLGVGSTCQFSSSYKISQGDSPYYSMRTCSFLRCSSSSGSSSWNLRAPLET